MHILLYERLLKNKQKQVNAIKSLDPSNKLKQIEGIFPQNLINNLIRDKLKKNIDELQDIRGWIKNNFYCVKSFPVV